MGKETKNNGNLLRLLASALGLFSLYFFLFSHYGFYLFLADYQELETWYPNYHVYIFVLVRSIHIGFGLALGYILIRLFLYLRESDSPIRKLVRFALSHKEALLMKNGAEYYSCQHLAYFWSAQTVLLTITLFGYFLLKTIVPQHAQVWQLYLSRGYIILALNGIAVFMWMNSRYFISSFITFMYRPTGPYNIAIYRMVFFLILAKDYFVFMTERIQYVESKPREALPFIGWLIDVLPISVQTYYWACVLGIVCCVFLTLGLFTRSLPCGERPACILHPRCPKFLRKIMALAAAYLDFMVSPICPNIRCFFIGQTVFYQKPTAISVSQLHISNTGYLVTDRVHLFLVRLSQTE
jgi:hypothetical protein